MFTLSLIVIVAMFAYIAYLQNQITRKDNLITQWVAYADQIEASYSDLYAECDLVLRKYGHNITSLKIAQGIVPVERVKYTEGKNSAKPKTRVATQIALFDQSDMFNGEFTPEFNQDGVIVYAPKLATNGNGHKVESTETKTDNKPKTAKSEVKAESHAPDTNKLSEDIIAIEKILGDTLNGKERESAEKQLKANRTIAGIAESIKAWRKNEAKKNK